MNQKELVKEIINTIGKEINQSYPTRYVCEDESIINADVGCVENWFNEYTHVLIERYNI